MLQMKGVTGLSHLQLSGDSYGLLLSRKDYRLSCWEPSGKTSVVAGQAMSRGSVDGLGTEAPRNAKFKRIQRDLQWFSTGFSTGFSWFQWNISTTERQTLGVSRAQARFSAPAQQLLLGDGSLLVADGQKLRRLEMKALRQSEVARTAQSVGRAAELAAQRARRLRAAWDEVLRLLRGPLTTIAATRWGLRARGSRLLRGAHGRRGFCDERYELELERSAVEATLWSSQMLHMAPSVHSAERLLRKAENKEILLQERAEALRVLESGELSNLIRGGLSL